MVDNKAQALYASGNGNTSFINHHHDSFQCRDECRDFLMLSFHINDKFTI